MFICPRNTHLNNFFCFCPLQVHDLRLNENKLKAVLFTSMYRFTNITDLNLTKNEINYIEDGAFAGQANLQVGNHRVLSFFVVIVYVKIRRLSNS